MCTVALVSLLTQFCAVLLADTKHYHSRVAAEVDENLQVMGVKVLLSH